MQLTELSFPAIAASLGADDQVELSEGWAQQRSTRVLEQLLELAGPGAALTTDDHGLILRRRSRARRAVRLRAFDLEEQELTTHFDHLEVLDIPDGSLTVLIGDFGSGKSEVAEAWHRASIDHYAAGTNEPIPLWLSARDLGGQLLQDAIERQAGPGWRQGRGASIVIDGLDEADPGSAQALLDSSRVLVRSHTTLRFLLTSRPGILSPNATEKAEAALLSEQRALELVELAVGTSLETWRWTADMRTTVTRPFFALAAGTMIRRGQVPRGEADLIRALVEDALAMGTERTAVTSEQTRTVLQNLAVHLTRGSVGGLAFGDRQIARSSRLVADGLDGTVSFSPPILQHWFAGQAIL